MHANNRDKYILNFDKEQTKGLDNTSLTTEAGYSVIFSRSKRKLYLSLHYNGSSIFLFVNGTKKHQFQAKDSEIRYPLCLGNILKYFP